MSLDEHPEVKPIFRNEVQESVKQPRTTRPYFSMYEYTALMSIRTQQLAEGSKPLVEITGLKTSDPRFLEYVAKREIEQHKLPFIVRRQLPNGTSEFWSAQELELAW